MQDQIQAILIVSAGVILGTVAATYASNQDTNSQIDCKPAVPNVQMFKRKSVKGGENTKRRSLVGEQDDEAKHTNKYNRIKRLHNTVKKDILNLARPIIDLPPHLTELVSYEAEDEIVMYESPLLGDNSVKQISDGSKFIPLESFMPDDAFVIASKSHLNLKDVATSMKFLKAGPRKDIFFNPDEVKACIVTCGGLCPGLNVVIREIVMSLWYNYEVKEIYGIKWGYKGFYEDNWQKLTPSDVSEIHKKGGTILGSSRGGYDGEKILNALIKRGISQVYIIGGDGTHRGINALSLLAAERGVNISFAGIPKTIDNDIPLIDQSFGFATSCEVAAQMIQSAYIEATCVINGIGLIKLMGRQSGYIAMISSLSHSNIDICLIPENPFELDGPNGLYQQVYDKIKKQGHCVIVVAEGAEDGLINQAEKFTKVEKRDGSGNIKLDDIGEALKDKLVSVLKEKYKMSANLKYVDPTYAIRSVPSNSADTIMCAKLAQNAVHGSMAGYTAFTTGIVRSAVCWIPIKTINQAGINRVSIYDRTWQRLLGSIRQSNMVNPEFQELAFERIQKEEQEKQDRFDKINERIKQEDQQREELKKQICL